MSMYPRCQRSFDRFAIDAFRVRALDYLLTIVNLDRVREIVHDNRGDHVVVLTTGARVKTSHQRWVEFATSCGSALVVTARGQRLRDSPGLAKL